MDIYPLIKVLHILSATVLFGTGLGTAFFMFRSHQAQDVKTKYHIAKTTVLADTIFTAPAAITQPLTGFVLMNMAGFETFEYWLIVTYGLYVLAGLCWFPVVWIQIRLKNILLLSHETGEDLPDHYHRLFRNWFLLGWPAFLGLLVIFYMMVAKPTW